MCNEQKEARGKLGKRCADLLHARLAELRAASCLDDIRYYPRTRLHPMRANRKGQWSVDLEHPLRLYLVPYNDPVPMLKSGGVDLTQVTEVLIVDIDDPH